MNASSPEMTGINPVALQAMSAYAPATETAAAFMAPAAPRPPLSARMTRSFYALVGWLLIRLWVAFAALTLLTVLNLAFPKAPWIRAAGYVWQQWRQN